MKRFILNKIILNNKLGCIIYIYSSILRSLIFTIYSLKKIKWPIKKIIFRDVKNISIINFSAEQKCHILCSGESLLKTIHFIDKDDFVIGCNFSGLISQKENIHFFSHAQIENNVPTPTTALTIKMANNMKVDKFIWSNLSNLNSSSKYKKKYPFTYKLVNEKFITDHFYMIDAVMPNVDLKNEILIKLCAEIAASGKTFFFCQYMNSLLSILSLCSSLPFDKFILHGCDIDGIHFYFSPDFVPPFYTNKKELTLVEKYNANFHRQKNNLSISSIEDLLPFYRSAFLKKKKYIFAANQETGCSRIIPHYY